MMVILRRWWIQLTANKRKFSFLCAGAGFALLLWARLIVVSNLPRTAVATPSHEGAAPLSTAERASEAGRPAADPSSPSTVRITLDERSTRDPFAISVRYFPKPAPPPEFGTEQGKSRGQPVENPQDAEARRLALVAARVQECRLEACMSSASMAVINGHMIRIGEMFEALGPESIALTLQEVKHRSVVLEFEGRQFELKMSQPGG